MLQDLYLLSCYFEPSQAVQYEDDLNRRYGCDALSDALRQGLIELYCFPCRTGRGRMMCRLSALGRKMAQQAA